MVAIWNPEIFQGKNKKKNYFEGWYFKSVSADEETAYALIPGLSLSKDQEKSHAFIMLMDARNQKLYHFKYPLAEFSATKNKFEIKIAENIFSLEHIHLNINNGEVNIQADLKFKNIIPWPVTLFSPGAMGWYRFIPFMECYHGVLSFDHIIHGFIEIDGNRKNLTDGKGYTEKD